MSSQSDETTVTSDVALERIIYAQTILFDGFVRMKILSNLKNSAFKIIPQDIIYLCNHFYELNIKSLSQNRYERIGLTELSQQCFSNKEYFISFSIEQLLINRYPNGPQYHMRLALVARNWNLPQQTADSRQKAVELAPENTQYRVKYGFA